MNGTTTLTYDVAGNVATSKDVRDRITTFEYDVKNRLKKVCDPLLEETGYTYDNRLTLADAPNTTTYAYDVLNRLTSLTAGGFTFAYDGLSRQTSLTLPNGTSIG